MTPRDRAIAVTLTNEADTEVVLQADINAWSQKPDGTDELVLHGRPGPGAPHHQAGAQGAAGGARWPCSSRPTRAGN